MDPKKQMRFAERMGKGKYTNLYTTCLVRSCFCLLCRVCLSFPCMRVFSWSGATLRLRKKKCPNHLPPQLLPTFATFVSQPIQHDQSWHGKHHHHPTYMCALHNFLLKNSQDTIHLPQLAPRLVLQLLQRLQKRVPGNGANCCNIKFS